MSRIYKYIIHLQPLRKNPFRHPQKHQDTHLKPLWDQYQKVIKSTLLELVLSTPGANTKVIKSSPWDWFCRLLGPSLKSHQVEPPGTGFVNSWHRKGAGGETMHPNCQRIRITEAEYYRLRSCWIEAPLQPFASFLKCCYRSSHKQCR